MRIRGFVDSAMRRFDGPIRSAIDRRVSSRKSAALPGAATDTDANGTMDLTACSAVFCKDIRALLRSSFVLM